MSAIAFLFNETIHWVTQKMCFNRLTQEKVTDAVSSKVQVHCNYWRDMILLLLPAAILLKTWCPVVWYSVLLFGLLNRSILCPKVWHRFIILWRLVIRILLFVCCLAMQRLLLMGLSLSSLTGVLIERWLVAPYLTKWWSRDDLRNIPNGNTFL